MLARYLAALEEYELSIQHIQEKANVTALSGRVGGRTVENNRK